MVYSSFLGLQNQSLKLILNQCSKIWLCFFSFCHCQLYLKHLNEPGYCIWLCQKAFLCATPLFQHDFNLLSASFKEVKWPYAFYQVSFTFEKKSFLRKALSDPGQHSALMKRLTMRSFHSSHLHLENQMNSLKLPLYQISLDSFIQLRDKFCSASHLIGLHFHKFECKECEIFLVVIFLHPYFTLSIGYLFHFTLALLFLWFL